MRNAENLDLAKEERGDERDNQNGIHMKYVWYTCSDNDSVKRTLTHFIIGSSDATATAVDDE